MDGRNVSVTLRRVTMEALADRIQTNAGLGRPVVDKTGLAGTYELKLSYTPEERKSRGPDPDPNEISIFTAVQDQLGLKLEPQAVIRDFLVIDRIQKLSEN